LFATTTTSSSSPLSHSFNDIILTKHQLTKYAQPHITHNIQYAAQQHHAHDGSQKEEGRAKETWLRDHKQVKRTSSHRKFFFLDFLSSSSFYCNFCILCNLISSTIIFFKHSSWLSSSSSS
jgi:hypothetical protein